MEIFPQTSGAGRRLTFACALGLSLSCLVPIESSAETAGRAFQQMLQLNLQALQKATPFQNNSGQMPPPSQYAGPFFQLNHAWPTSPPSKMTNAPWQVAIGNKPITVANAATYTAALKKAVTENGRSLIMNYDQWDAAKAGWYNEPWLGSLREPIHGAYTAGQFGPGIFPNTGLDATFRTTVVTYYDERAAYSLNKVWGKTAMTPTISTDAFQFDEGSIIVKAAIFYSTDPKKETNWWTAMQGAQPWRLFTPVAQQQDNPQPSPQLWTGYVAQFDIIVKDSQSAPQTGWVFTTLVYDSSAPGDVWDKMVPLGAQWGNDPQAGGNPALMTENWINPQAPTYSTQTLGWGGRLSGPNDGATNPIAVNGKTFDNAPNSSCMSCHSTSQWDPKQNKMVTFLLPSYPPQPGERAPFEECGNDGKPAPGGNYICSPAPGSAEWMKWFQNRLGTVPMDAGSIATDFDEVFSFKSLPLWYAATATNQQNAPVMLMRPSMATPFNQYTGAPLPKPDVSK
ncbi:hypothetical protein LRS73_20075 [Methylobacterium currus]|uniref:hypothetical protein n=1 Tax=Methylobacterium currus TaxID=2051553 RepID=UPI001E33B105|nr:hypothetical protein [Methylobacterium currus]UHC14821.1 hypothetical protein LRS73_20075 [Methylobacterium currus]